MKIFNIAAAGALLLAAGGQAAYAQSPGRPMGRGRGMNRPVPPAVMMKDADMKVENTPSGAIIRYTSGDPETIKKIQESAAIMKERHDSLKAAKSDKKDGKKDGKATDAKAPEDNPADAGDSGKKNAKTEPQKDAAREKPKDDKLKDDKPKDKEAK